MSAISENFKKISDHVVETCEQNHRNIDDVKLVVVTKGQPVVKILEVIQAGAIILGENYPEETQRKISEENCLKNRQWHMIGHLQSRKIPLLFPNFKMIHSIDSFDLCNKLNRYYEKMNSTLEALIEINVSGETTKYGFEASTIENRKKLMDDFQELKSFSNLRFKGLMTMPPYSQEKGQNTGYYQTCFEFLNLLQQNIFDPSFCELSMGTSADYDTAIASGATYVRIGEAIMGARNYSN